MNKVIWFKNTRYEVQEDGVYTDFCGFVKMTKTEIASLVNSISGRRYIMEIEYSIRTRSQ